MNGNFRAELSEYGVLSVVEARAKPGQSPLWTSSQPSHVGDWVCRASQFGGIDVVQKDHRNGVPMSFFCVRPNDRQVVFGCCTLELQDDGNLVLFSGYPGNHLGPIWAALSKPAPTRVGFRAFVDSYIATTKAGEVVEAPYGMLVDPFQEKILFAEPGGRWRIIRNNGEVPEHRGKIILLASGEWGTRPTDGPDVVVPPYGRYDQTPFHWLMFQHDENVVVYEGKVPDWARPIWDLWGFSHPPGIPLPGPIREDPMPPSSDGEVTSSFLLINSKADNVSGYYVKADNTGNRARWGVVRGTLHFRDPLQTPIGLAISVSIGPASRAVVARYTRTYFEIFVSPTDPPWIDWV